MNTARTISFSPPDISQAEIDAVSQVLKSGWITTGPATKELERQLVEFTGAAGIACLSSATAALECALRALGIGEGDEVIVPAYTYTASCSPIVHVGATPVLIDTAPNSFELDYHAIAACVTERTKAIIPVDIAGRMCDYDRLFEALQGCAHLWQPSNALQKRFSRVIVITDGAHSLGATYKGMRSGEVADLTTFSFHAVKNFTTAEGGALAWRKGLFDSEDFYRSIMLLSLHGQTKDALAKSKGASWEYDIAFPGWKCNMTDIQAALGLEQLKRYSGLLARRRKIIERYEAGFAAINTRLSATRSTVSGPTSNAPHIHCLTHFDAQGTSSGHLMLVRIDGFTEAQRNDLIARMGEAGVATNVHYKPLPLLSAYRALGFSIDDFPNAYAQYVNEVSLPLHTLLTDDDVNYVLEVFERALIGVWNTEECAGNAANLPNPANPANPANPVSTTNSASTSNNKPAAE